jgi:hypothetical protein
VIAGLLLCATLGAPAAPRPEADHRAWQHGVDFIQVGGKLLLLWGSAGNPPAAPGRDWQHDIYYAWVVEPQSAQPRIEPRVLVSRPEAQEPPSAAINSAGVILVTSEDGEKGINQYAGLWDSTLRALRPYPFEIRRGGHSGHVAAMGERFLVAYGEGWVDGGAWRGLGTGESIYARVVQADGKPGREAKLTAGNVAKPRDSWPRLAASDRNWLVVWQRYPGLTLQSALVDAAGKVVNRGTIVDGLPLRYAYDVQFSPQLNVYVVAGTSGESGFVALVGVDGKLLKLKKGLPPMAGEGRIVLGSEGSHAIGVYPASPGGVAVVQLAAGAIGPARLVAHPYAWDYAGTASAFVAPDRVLFATLSTQGLRLFPVSLRP